MKECATLGVKTYSDPSYIFLGVRTPPTPRIYALELEVAVSLREDALYTECPSTRRPS